LVGDEMFKLVKEDRMNIQMSKHVIPPKVCGDKIRQADCRPITPVV
jgi:hypothetical protein